MTGTRGGAERSLNSPPADTAPEPTVAAGTSPRRLYLVRGLVAIAWAVAFMALADSLTPVAAVLLVIYPLIDLVAVLVDASRPHRSSERRVLYGNAVTSALAAVAVAVAVATSGGSRAVLAAFGVWATLSGIAQLVVALRRRGPQSGGQWPMLIAGALSTLVGIVYNVTAATSLAPTFDPLVAYAAAGGAFFVIQAGLLTWRARRPATGRPARSSR
ncbi:membrane protein [Actinomycetospora sp. NBRC 106375]|uniref:DUF308 domain-containing protein n=1 Tax=Actinomycetospora sp. NBRC 106375 TaxID=3032207 RepID=UPI0024A1F4AB|nr:DUF308 domain-containing protein [Actinomycetospora sp. NBRC 106375]GLZ48848.1 membrane protein [Actinomycetospora sp. NBRC 106375]